MLGRSQVYPGGVLQTVLVYRESQKKYTSLKSKVFVPRSDQSLKLVLFVRNVLNVDFDT